MKHCAYVMVIGEMFSYDNDNHPEVRVTESGLEVSNFVVKKTNYDRETGEPREYEGKVSRNQHRCVAWADHAQAAAAIPCGSTVLVTGIPQPRKNEKTGEWREEINVRTVMMLEAGTGVLPERNSQPAGSDRVEFPDVSNLINLDENEDYV